MTTRRTIVWIITPVVIGGALAAALVERPSRAPRDGGENSASGGEAHAPRPAAETNEAGPPLTASTPAEVREVVRFTRAAGQGDAGRLRELALLSPDALVAANAVRALGRLDAFAGDQDLVALLDDARVRVRQEAVRALGESGEPAAAGRLGALLDDPPLRHLAIRALGQVGGPLAEERLEELLADAGSTVADRAFAGEALRAVRGRAKPDVEGVYDGKQR